MQESHTDPTVESSNIINTAEKNRPPYIRSQLISSTPTAAVSKAKARIDFQFDTDCIELGHSTPYHTSSCNKIVNSTPVNHNHGSSFRSRKDLTKTSFK